jgi:hypothetical protein
MAVDTVDVRETASQWEVVSAWAEALDAPIQLGRFPCCDRYVCRCRQGEED